MVDDNDLNGVRSGGAGRAAFYATLLTLLIVGGLLVYKGSAALGVLEGVRTSGVLRARADVIPLEGRSDELSVVARIVNYFVVIGPALAFGILIGGAVRAFATPQWTTQVLGGSTFRSQLAAATAGAPLMLCSCCVAPVFTSVYERSSRLGPSLAVMLAAPLLNPAALVLTFMLFEPAVAAARLILSILAVLLTGVLVSRLFGTAPLVCSAIGVQAQPLKSLPQLISTFLRSSMDVAARTVPLIALGVLSSMMIARWLPMNTFVSPGERLAAVGFAALIAVPLALPTFFEIPLALSLAAAGLPVGATVAVLFAGPAINLPSLLTIARSTNWKIAAAVATTIWLLALAGGLLIN